MVPAILADTNQIKEVLWNVFLNAVESMPNGGVISFRISIEKPSQKLNKKEISIKGLAQTYPDYLMVSITDQGCGISEFQMKKIMDPFVSFKDNGIGLGLSIVSQIMKSHNGQIKINSSPGKGTCLKLLFPLIKQEN